MNNKIKLFAIAGALTVAVPASASAHHDDNDDYRLVKTPSFSGLVKRVAPNDAPSTTPSPAEVSTPRVKVWRRTYIQGGRPGTVGIKISCKSVAGLGCGGQVGIGPSGRLGTRSFQTRQSRPQIVRVSLSRGMLARLFWRGKLTTKLTVEASDELGNASVTTGELNLLRVR